MVIAEKFVLTQKVGEQEKFPPPDQGWELVETISGWNGEITKVYKREVSTDSGKRLILG